jgi:hypothetical protein
MTVPPFVVLTSSREMSDRFIHIGRLERAVPKRKPGIREAYMKVGKPVSIRGQPFWQVSESDYQAMRKEFALEKPKPSTASGVSGASKASTLPTLQRTNAPPRLPGIFTAAKNAASAATRIITAAANGQTIQVPEAEFQRRMTICQACENYIKETQRCAKCACFLERLVIGKARLATEACPDGNW